MIDQEQIQARNNLQQSIIDALDEELPLSANIAALAFVLCQCVQLKGTMNKDKFVDSMATTWDVVVLHNALSNVVRQ